MRPVLKLFFIVNIIFAYSSVFAAFSSVGFGKIFFPIEEELRSAAHDGDIETVEEFIWKKVSVNAQDSNGQTALMEAIDSENINIVQLLLAEPAKTNVNLCNKNGSSALILAASYGQPYVVHILLDQPDINIDLQDNEGWTALMCAANIGSKIIVQKLLAAYAKVDLVNRDNKDALQIASEAGQKEIVEILKNHSAANQNKEIEPVKVLDKSLEKCAEKESNCDVSSNSCWTNNQTNDRDYGYCIVKVDQRIMDNGLQVMEIAFEDDNA
jgi:hypothetical protein